MINLSLKHAASIAGYRLNQFWVVVFTSSIVLFGCSTEKATVNNDHGPEPEAWAHSDNLTPSEDFIEDLMAQMSLREKIAQLFMVAGRGGFYPEGDRGWERMHEAVTRHQVGGVMFFSGRAYEQAIITNKLQKKSTIPLWISQDMEFGAAMRIDEATYLAPAMGIAATQNRNFAYQKGRITAKEAGALGVHQIYAPVLDINNNPLNPVINVRSYSEVADTVAKYGIAFMEGVHDAGLMATAKHFPGHGDTDVDSHVDLPVLPIDYERLTQVELVPFKKAFQAGMKSIMTAHIALPEIALFPDYPATLDPGITSHILRDSLRFDGVVVTDGMGMRGVSNYFDAGDAAVLAIKAGVDQILLSADLEEAINAIELAVISGDIEESRIDASVKRVLEMKMDTGLFSQPQLVDIYELTSKINTREFRRIADAVAESSITLLKNDGNLLPLDGNDFEKVVVVNISDGRRTVNDHITGMLDEKFKRLESVHIHPGMCSADSLEATKTVASSDLVVALSHLAIRTAEEISLDEMVSPMISKLFDTEAPVIAVSLGSPYILGAFDDADVHMLAWSPRERQQVAAGYVLTGAAGAGGKLPVTIPSLYDIGDGIILEAVQ